MTVSPPATTTLLDFLLAAANCETPAQMAEAIVDLSGQVTGSTRAAVCDSNWVPLASHGLGSDELHALADRQESPSALWPTFTDGITRELHPGADLLVLLAYSEPVDSDLWDRFNQIVRAGIQAWQLATARQLRLSWGPVTREFTQAVVADLDEEESLSLATELALRGGSAVGALLFLPSINRELACEFTAGEDTARFIGMPLEITELTREAFARGEGQCAPAYSQLVHDPLGALARYGSGLVFPLLAGDETVGAMLLLRAPEAPSFSGEHLPHIQNFAATISLSLELAQGRQAQSVALMLEERDRIGRDLHDLGIQLLFATGMQLDKLRAEVEEGRYSNRRIAEELRGAIVSLEDAVGQIRQVVSGLKDTEERQTFVEQLEQEASRSRRVLGFAPSLILELDGHILEAGSDTWAERSAELTRRVGEELAEDAIATIREALSNVARHAGARSVKIEVSVNGRAPVGELLVSVIDDGRGINLSRNRSSGIANMGNRAAYRGGSFAVGMGPRGRGTSVVWRVPLLVK
ncbi:histidine kinase [Actinomyces sp. F1_1611]